MLYNIYRVVQDTLKPRVTLVALPLRSRCGLDAIESRLRCKVAVLAQFGCKDTNNF